MYRQIPSLNWLRVFEAAANFENFSNAAKELAMTPAAVSQQIRALEAHLDCQLFERGAHSVRLTDAGRAFLPTVQQSLSSIDRQAAGLFGGPTEPRLAIEGNLLFMTGWLSSVVGDFQEHYEDVHLHLSIGDDEPDFLKHDKDFQISYGAGPRNDCEGDRLFGETLYPVALPEIAEQVSSGEDLLRFPLIEVAPHRNSWPVVLRQLGLDMPATAKVTFTDNTVVAAALAGAGGGIALARAPASNAICDTYGLVRCLKGSRVSGSQDYYLLYPSKAGLSKVAGAFRDWILSVSRSAN